MFERCVNVSVSVCVCAFARACARVCAHARARAHALARACMCVLTPFLIQTVYVHAVHVLPLCLLHSCLMSRVNVYFRSGCTSHSVFSVGFVF